jgi:hypothetical protein
MAHKERRGASRPLKKLLSENQLLPLLTLRAGATSSFNSPAVTFSGKSASSSKTELIISLNRSTATRGSSMFKIRLAHALDADMQR